MLAIQVFFFVLSITCVVDASTGSSTSCQIDRARSSLICRNVPTFQDISSALSENVVHGLHKIDIYLCKLETLSAFLSSDFLSNDTTVASIEKVAVVQCGVRHISTDVFSGFDLGVLVHLDLSGNLLEIIPEAVLQLTALQTLNLADNRISQLPPGSAFNSLNALSYFDLRNNRLGSTESNDSQALSSSSDRNTSLSLLVFNLEPLTDSLEVLIIAGNSLQALPMQFRGRNFARLRTLDLSDNNLRGLPQDAFVGLTELETLNMNHNELKSIVLQEEAAPNLQSLLMEGNPIDCDCHARWLWSVAKDENTSRNIKHLKLALCNTPFSVKNLKIETLDENTLCDLLPGNRKPRFFRVSKQDEPNFPTGTFDSFGLDNVEIVSNNSIDVRWHVGLGFYYTDYDWGLIFRRIGDADNPNMFYKTRHDLKTHIEKHAEEWTPKDESFEALLDSLEVDTYYEICLAIVDRSTVYYLHRQHCKEVRTQKLIEEHPVTASVDGPVRTENITLVADVNSITVKWNITIATEGFDKVGKDETFTLIRRISLRPFGTDNITRLFVLEDFNLTSLSQRPSLESSSRYYTLSQLHSGTGYVVCFETLPDPTEDAEDHAKRHRSVDEKDGRNTCWEMTTLDDEVGFPVTEVASAAAVSTTTTAFVVMLVCCCCFPGFCGRDKRRKEKNHDEVESGKGKDENDNERNVGKNDDVSKQSRRAQTMSRSSASPVRSTSLPPSTSSFEPELQSIAITKSDDEDDIPQQDVIMRNDKDVKFRERYDDHPDHKSPKNSHFWKSCLADAAEEKRRRHRRSLSADDSGSVRYALIERKSDGNLSIKSDSKKNSLKKSSEREKPKLQEDITVPYYFSPSRFEGNWSECATALASGAGGHYHTMPNPSRQDVAHFSKRILGSGRSIVPPPPMSGPPSFIPDGSLLAMYDSRRVGMPIRPPNPSPHHHPHQHPHHHHHAFHHSVAQFPIYKRPIECYYTPPQTDYYQRPPPDHIHIHLPHHRQFWQEPPVDYARTLGRTRREAPMISNQANATKPEMSKLKRLLFVRAAASSNTSSNKEELKMCTWSPYTSYECHDYGQRQPFRVKDKSKSAQKSLDELRF